MNSNPKSILDILNVSNEPPKLSESVVGGVDAQREYRDGALKLSGIDEALVELSRLLKKARDAGSPIFHIVHHTAEGAPVFDPTGSMVEILEAARPEGDEPVISKNLPSSFVGTNLEDLVRKTGRDNVIIAGFMTHMCINATARSAVDLGFKPAVIASACATRDLPGPGGNTISADIVHNSNLASLADLVATIAGTPEDLEV